MTQSIRLALLACVLACGCSEPVAPAVANYSGQWYTILSLSGTVGSGTATCTGLLNLTLTQTDTLLSGEYVPNFDDFGCNVTGTGIGGGWAVGFLAPYGVAGIVRASGDVRLSAAAYPDSLVLVGGGTPDRVDGAASFSLPYTPAGGATVNVPLTGTFILVRPATPTSALSN